MPRLKLLLLDAGIVIGLHKFGLWDKLLSCCEITLTRTVADDEVIFWEDESGQRQYIDKKKFNGDVEESRLTVIDVPLSQIDEFCKQFDPSYLDRLDDGEAESLAFLLSSQDDYLISSADSIVFKVLGRLALADRGISLEEILQQVGLSRSLEWKYSKDFRLHYTALGQQDSVTGTGLL